MRQTVILVHYYKITIGYTDRLCGRPVLQHTTSSMYNVITRAPQGVRVIAVFLAKRGVMVPGVPYVNRGNWGQDLALCEYSVLRIIFWQESDLILWCHMQRPRSFSEGVGPRVIVLESQPGKQSSRLKRSREITTEPIAEWVQTTKILTKQ